MADAVSVHRVDQTTVSIALERSQASSWAKVGALRELLAAIKAAGIGDNDLVQITHYRVTATRTTQLKPKEATPDG